jgi:large subunit ribosomal protein L4
MAKIDILNQAGEKVSDMTLEASIFEIEPNMQAVYDVINAERAALRQGTHKTKTISEVRGGGRKPYRQKGTGRARQGSIRSPQFVGGSTMFGPVPHKYNLKVNKKVRKLALKSLLADRFKNGNLIVVDAINLDDFKTKKAIEVIKALKLEEKKTIFITNEENYNFELATRNLPQVYVQTKSHLSLFDLIKGECYVIFSDAIKQYQEELK